MQGPSLTEHNIDGKMKLGLMFIFVSSVSSNLHFHLIIFISSSLFVSSFSSCLHLQSVFIFIFVACSNGPRSSVHCVFASDFFVHGKVRFRLRRVRCGGGTKRMFHHRLWWTRHDAVYKKKELRNVHFSDAVSREDNAVCQKRKRWGTCTVTDAVSRICFGQTPALFRSQFSLAVLCIVTSIFFSVYIFNYRFTISVSILCLSNPLCLSAFRIFVFLYKRTLEVFFVERRLRFLHRGGGGAVEEGDSLFCLSSSIVTMATEVSHCRGFFFLLFYSLLRPLTSSRVAVPPFLFAS